MALIAIPFFLTASPIVGDTIKAPRPKIGLVLGGGGAKGAAHIGVLKYIDEIGLPIDYVAGTSMGSIIGGLYALGYDPDEIQTMITELDWSQYMSNSVNRSIISAADKDRQSTYLINIPFGTGELADKLNTLQEEDNGQIEKGSLLSTLPDSFIPGSDLLNLFNSLCIGYQDSTDFNALPIPFACIATNLASGEEVVLRNGKVPEAIRASMAIPGVFSPVTIDGKLLVDGGLVNNFPTDVCQQMGADIIIGIEVAQGLVTDVNKLKTLPQLAAQLKNIMVQGHNDQNRELCDLYFHPNVGDFSMLSFNSEAIDTIVSRGYQYASQYENELKTLKNYVDSFQPSSKTLHAPKAQYVTNDTICIEQINMNNVSFDEAKWLYRKSGIDSGDPVPAHDILKAVNIFKGTGHFENIAYTLSPAQQISDPSSPYKSYDLNLAFAPSEPHKLSLGFSYDSEESASLILSLGINRNRFSGWKFDFTGRLGFNTKANATITWAGISLANFNLSYDFQRSKLNIYTFQQPEASLFLRNRLSLSISEFHLRDLQASCGFEIESFNYPNIPYTAVTIFDAYGINSNGQTLKSRCFGPFAKLRFDNMDDAYFATKGSRINGEIHGRFCQSSKFADISFNTSTYLGKGRLIFIPQIYARVLCGEREAFTYTNLIGGSVYGRYYDYQMPFIGTNGVAITGAVTGIARLDIRYRVYGKHYLSLLINGLRSAPTFSAFASRTTLDLPDTTEEYYTFPQAVNRYGIGIKYAYNSPIGPISFDIHYSDCTQQWGSYFSIGYEF